MFTQIVTKTTQMNYSEKLKDPRWQKVRLKAMERDSFCCSKCLNDKITLHVHHKVYLTGKEPWDYPLHYLTTLCEQCHEAEHSTGLTQAISYLKERGHQESDILKALDPRFVHFAKDFHPEILKFIRIEEAMGRYRDYLASSLKGGVFKKPIQIEGGGE